MSYDVRILRRAKARHDEALQRHEEELRARRRTCYAQEPRLREIDQELSGTMAKIVAAAFRRGTDPAEAVEKLKRENLGLQRERGELLSALGYAPDYLEPRPCCSLCGDRGWIENRMCGCLKRFYSLEQNAELSRMLDLGSQSFDTFDFSFYSPTESYGRRRSARENMDHNYETCIEFSHHFPSRIRNMLFTGDPGLGKTFLSACIAREVSEKGHSVVYDTAIHVFSCFEAQKFSREEDDEAESDVDRVLRCDLLILDDLGTEMPTSFVQSAFYRILNTRLTEQRSTVISTNLNPVELGKRYGAPILSRIRGEYTILPFYGVDIRLQRNQ